MKYDQYEPVFESRAEAENNPVSIDVMGLYTYPVKSCAGVRLQEAEITRRGLKHDRDYMLVDERGKYLSQRQIPEMALVVPKIGDAALTLSAPGISDLEIPLHTEPDDSQLIVAEIHNKLVYGQVVGGDAGAWFTDCLPRYRDNQSYELIKVREDKPRNIDDQYQIEGASNKVGFADSFSMLLASNTSLAQLNTDLDEEIGMDRFRPNIIIDGEELEPYDEDFWQEVRIGQMSAFVVKACDRCVVPDVNQKTAARSKVVGKALAASRRGVNAYDPGNKGVFFAQNLNHVYIPGTTIYFNDPVMVRERASERNLILRTPHKNKLC